MKPNLYLLTFLGIFFAACDSSTPKEEKAKLETYTSKEVGWTIEIPEGYKKLSKTRLEANEKKWKQALANANEDETTSSKSLLLVNFQKNQFNSLLATAQVFDLTQDGDYLVNRQLVKKMIYDTYTNQKIKVDTLSAIQVTAGQKFQTFNITLFGPNGEVLLNQITYNKLINGYDFGISINYNTETDKEILINAFKNSKFVK